MTREDLDHLLRAAGDLTGHKRFVLIGSNARPTARASSISSGSRTASPAYQTTLSGAGP